MPSLFQNHNILDGFRGSQHIHTTPSFPTTMDFIDFLTADGHRVMGLLDFHCTELFVFSFSDFEHRVYLLHFFLNKTNIQLIESLNMLWVHMLFKPIVMLQVLLYLSNLSQKFGCKQCVCVCLRCSSLIIMKVIASLVVTVL